MTKTKEYRQKNVCPFLVLENSTPLSPRGPLDFYQPAYELTLSKALPVQCHLLLEALLDSPASCLSSVILKDFVPLSVFRN